MNKNNLKVAHIHVWDKTNKGDLAIVMAVQELIKINFPGCRISDFPMEAIKEGQKDRTKEINKCDFVIIGGGGVLYRYFLPFSKQIIKNIKIPVYLFSVGYIREIGAAKLDDKEKNSIKALAEKAELIGARDYYTKAFLKRLGISNTKIRLIGDAAINLGEDKPAKMLAGHGVKIGLNLNYSGWLGFGLWEKEILKAYQEVAGFFQQKHGAKIFYLLHHPGERKIIPKLKVNGLETIDLAPRRQKHFYGELDLVIGMMLHSCVLAFGAGTPEINLAYDLRNKNFAKFIGCPELLMPLEKLPGGNLLKLSKKVFAGRNDYREKFKRKKQKILDAQNAFIESIETK